MHLCPSHLPKVPLGPATLPLHHRYIVVTLHLHCTTVTRYGFNPGSTLAIPPTGYAATAARATICTTLSAAFGGMTVVLLTKKLDHIWDLGVCPYPTPTQYYPSTTLTP